MVLMLDTPCSGVECKTTGYPLHSHVSPSLPLPRVTMGHQVSTEFYMSYSRLISYTWVLVSISSKLTYIFSAGWEWIHTWTITNHLQIIRMGTLHTITHRMYQLLCPHDKFKLAFNNSIPEHYSQACILYTSLNYHCQTLMNCCRGHKSQQTPTRNFKEPAWQWHKCVSKH